MDWATDLEALTSEMHRYEIFIVSDHWPKSPFSYQIGLKKSPQQLEKDNSWNILENNILQHQNTSKIYPSTLEFFESSLNSHFTLVMPAASYLAE